MIQIATRAYFQKGQFQLTLNQLVTVLTCGLAETSVNRSSGLLKIKMAKIKKKMAF